MTGIRKYIEDGAKIVLPRVVEIRRDLHAHPELSFQEIRTSQVVSAILEEAGLEVSGGIATTGVVGLIRGREKGPTIALRADMDALPVTEATSLPFASNNPGVMHACGHDGHMAMLLGAAMVLVRLRDQLRGNIKCIFQPGEEGYAGARRMIEEGVLEQEPRIDAAFALHIEPLSPAGTLSIRTGPIMAGADLFTIAVVGKGGHGAMPHKSIDPIPVAGHLIAALQDVVSRKIDPVDSIVLSICTLRAGTAMTIIPDRVDMGGTVRLFEPSIRERMPGLMEEIVRGITSAFGATYEFNYIHGYPATINEPGFTKMVCSTAEKLLGEKNIHILARPRMPSEDFSFFLEKVPGAFAMLGAQPVNSPTCPTHSSTFTIDEAALEVGVKLHAAVALRYLGEEL